MVKEVVFSRKAFADIDRVVEFNTLRNFSEKYSITFVKTLFTRTNKLIENPNIGQLTNKKNEFVLIWSDFYIFYLIVDDRIIISRIFHQKENV